MGKGSIHGRMEIIMMGAIKMELSQDRELCIGSSIGKNIQGFGLMGSQANLQLFTQARYRTISKLKYNPFSDSI